MISSYYGLPRRRTKQHTVPGVEELAAEILTTARGDVDAIAGVCAPSRGASSTAAIVGIETAVRRLGWPEAAEATKVTALVGRIGVHVEIGLIAAGRARLRRRMMRAKIGQVRRDSGSLGQSAQVALINKQVVREVRRC